jgi:septal ring-binding cell division protein DamX
MLFVVFVRVFITVTGMGVTAVTPQIIADRTAGCTAQACTDGRSGRTAKTVADHRSTRRAQTTAYRRLGATVPGRGNGTAGRSADTRTNRCTSTAAQLATDHIAQHPTKTTAHGGISITSRQRHLRDQPSKNNRRQHQSSSTQACSFIAVGFRVHGTPRILQEYGRFERLLRETFINEKARHQAGLCSNLDQDQ